MKNVLKGLLIGCLIGSMVSCHPSDNDLDSNGELTSNNESTSNNGLTSNSGSTSNNESTSNSEFAWKLVWSEEFNINGLINDEIWSKIPRDILSPWQNTMSDHDALFDVKDGNLILRGMVNPKIPGDTSTYITGGIYTKDKKPFYHGKLEIRAKLQGAQGAWPAIWLMPFINAEWPRIAWPKGGEIDIMERLNYDTVCYQTVHSHYTLTLKKYIPSQTKTTPIVNNEYNVYGVELHKDSVVFSVNGKHTLTYPRIETTLEGQFPFDRPYYLKIDMQLGGDWVGPVDPNDLPVSMYVDWVRFYEWKR